MTTYNMSLWTNKKNINTFWLKKNLILARMLNGWQKWYLDSLNFGLNNLGMLWEKNGHTYVSSPML